MRLPERVSGASMGLGPLVDADMRLKPADVAAFSGEQNAHSGRRIQAPRKQPRRTTTQSPDRQVKLAIAPINSSLPPRQFSLKPAPCCIGYFVVTIFLGRVAVALVAVAPLLFNFSSGSCSAATFSK